MRITIALCVLLALAISAVPLLSPEATAEPVRLTEGLPTIEAEHGLAAHLKQGPCALIELVGAWTTQDMDGVFCSWPDDEFAQAVVLHADGEVVAYDMTLDGEVLDGPEWLSIRPCDAVGPEGNSPWEEGWEFSFSMASACTPVLHDFARDELFTMTFTGECWETPISNGSCDTEKSCTADEVLGCKVEWTTVGHVTASETSICGGDLVVQFYCEPPGTPRVRICN